MTHDKKERIDEVIDKLCARPVGNGYIDCICPLKNVNVFINAMSELNVKITGFTWWCFVNEGHEPCGMGGPQNRYGTGWYSEIPPMGAVYEFPNNEDVKNYLLIRMAS